MTKQNPEADLIQRIHERSFPLEPKPTGMTERLTPLTGVRAVLFDVYGTLFISGSGDISIASDMSNQRALMEALQVSGFSGLLDDTGAKGSKGLLQAIRRTHAKRREQGCAFPEVDIREEWQAGLTSLKKAGVLEGHINADAVQRVSVEYECRVNPVWPMPDMEETLQGLQEQDLLLGIVSNAQFYTLLMFPAFFERTHEASGFVPDLCAWSFQVLEAKPSTKMFHHVIEHLAKQFGIAQHETVYVGNDMLNDIWTASQCGLKTALFAGDQRSLRLREDDPGCAGLEPDVVITKLSQLLTVTGH
jgi:putative hydrolase of the HAD superfamily